MFDPIAIELDDDGKWIVFRRTQREPGGDFARALLELPLRFTLADVCEAALGTGLVAARNEQYFIEATTGCRDLANYIGRVLEYFEAGGTPGRELASIVGRIRAQFDIEESLPLWCFAWLDLIVREYIADLARSDSEPWTADRLDLDLAAIRDRRVHAFLEARRTQTSGPSAVQAKSQRTRVEPTPKDKTG